jgi:hypothetical protein
MAVQFSVDIEEKQEERRFARIPETFLYAMPAALIRSQRSSSCGIINNTTIYMTLKPSSSLGGIFLGSVCNNKRKEKNP